MAAKLVYSEQFISYILHILLNPYQTQHTCFFHLFFIYFFKVKKKGPNPPPGGANAVTREAAAAASPPFPRHRSGCPCIAFGSPIICGTGWPLGGGAGEVAPMGGTRDHPACLDGQLVWMSLSRSWLHHHLWYPLAPCFSGTELVQRRHWVGEGRIPLISLSECSFVPHGWTTICCSNCPLASWWGSRGRHTRGKDLGVGP